MYGIQDWFIHLFIFMYTQSGVQPDQILEYKLLASILSAVCSVIQQS